MQKFLPETSAPQPVQNAIKVFLRGLWPLESSIRPLRLLCHAVHCVTVRKRSEMKPLATLALLVLPALSHAAQPIQVLVITGHDHHDWRSTTPFLVKLLNDTGRFEVRVEEAPGGITAAT